MTTTRSQLVSAFSNGRYPDQADFSNLIDFATQVVSGDSDPTTADVANGHSILWRNTTTGDIRHWVNINGVLYRNSAWSEVDGWSPSDLYASSEIGGFWDFSSVSNLYQDAGSTPVAAHDDPIGRCLDLSGNDLHMNQTTSGSKPLFKIGGAESWAEFDGTNDYMDCLPTPKPSSYTVIWAGRLNALSGSQSPCGAGASDGNSLYQWGTMLSRSGSAKLEWSFGNEPATTSRYGDTSEDAFLAADDVILTHQFTAGQANAVLKSGATTLTPANQSGTATACAGDAYNFAVGRFGMFPNFYMAGRTYGLMCINRVLTTDEQAEVRNYFAARMPA